MQKGNNKHRRAWNKKSTASLKTNEVSTSVAPKVVLPPVNMAAPTTSATPHCTSPLVDVAGVSSSADHIDKHKESTEDTTSSLVEKSATLRKFKLFDVSLAAEAF